MFENTGLPAGFAGHALQKAPHRTSLRMVRGRSVHELHPGDL